MEWVEFVACSVMLSLGSVVLTLHFQRITIVIKKILHAFTWSVERRLCLACVLASEVLALEWWPPSGWWRSLCWCHHSSVVLVQWYRLSRSCRFALENQSLLPSRWVHCGGGGWVTSFIVFLRKHRRPERTNGSSNDTMVSYVPTASKVLYTSVLQKKCSAPG